MALAGAGKEKDVVVRAGGEQMFNKIFVVRFSADDAFAAAFLRTVIGHTGALNEAKVRDGNDATLVGNDVFHPEFSSGTDDLSAAGRGIFCLHLAEFLFDE